MYVARACPAGAGFAPVPAGAGIGASQKIMLQSCSTGHVLRTRRRRQKRAGVLRGRIPATIAKQAPVITVNNQNAEDSPHQEQQEDEKETTHRISSTSVRNTQ